MNNKNNDADDDDKSFLWYFNISRIKILYEKILKEDN
jgi:hypothetical protein